MNYYNQIRRETRERNNSLSIKKWHIIYQVFRVFSIFTLYAVYNYR